MSPPSFCTWKSIFGWSRFDGLSCTHQPIVVNLPDDTAISRNRSEQRNTQWKGDRMEVGFMDLAMGASSNSVSLKAGQGDGLQPRSGTMIW
jgi:hypothetical protein